MFVIKKLRLNKFEPRPIVSNRELFISLGSKPGTIQSKDTSDCYSDPSPDCASKTKILGLAGEICKASFEHHNAKDVSTLSTPAKDH